MPSSTPLGADRGGLGEDDLRRGGPGRALLATFDDGLARQDGLCRGLEDLADGLPDRLDTLRALELVGRLRATLEEVHHFEEERVFPALLQVEGAISPVLDRLRAEHAEDEDAASDLEDALAAFDLPRDGLATRRDGRRGGRGTGPDAERLGYMLRSLFTGLRRHVAHDREHIRPLLAAGGAR